MDDSKSILELLNKTNINEIKKNEVIFENLNNDMITENEIVSTVEDVKINEDYKYIFKENYIIQSVIHVNLRFNEYGTSTGHKKLDLYKIFNGFDLNDMYPFAQYQTTDKTTTIWKLGDKKITEFCEKTRNSELISEWFDNTAYGISIKTVWSTEKSGNRFLSININENGRIEYKTHWKAEDMATIEDIAKTYVYIYNLIDKINSEQKTFELIKPHHTEFKYAFINSIQHFVLPNKYIINHNDLSNFARYFYPYISLVIDPKKRQSKLYTQNVEKSKYGTYLRYKKVSQYENRIKIEQRIMYFMRNFEYTEKSLIDELSKQFNITEENAQEEYERIKVKYPHLKKARKTLKKFENIPKYKLPGIEISLQGKDPAKYKFRISGARDKLQLDRILSFMNVLLYLYVETYLRKNPQKQILKKKLEQLKNSAKRRNKVVDIVKYTKDVVKIKQMITIDKKRLGFKPEKGQNQWSRSCQKSGKDNKRQTSIYNSNNLDNMLKKGYFRNKKTGNYEKRVLIKEKGKRKEVILQAVKFDEYDENGDLTGNEIYHTCDPQTNGDHFYIGFLTKSQNPNGDCLPCCFKKDQLHSQIKSKKEFIESCLHPDKKHKLKSQETGDKFYILKDTNKLQDGRISSLPKYLEIYFNVLLGKTKKIKHSYLIETHTGYFFKYGIKQDEYPFLSCIGKVLSLTVQEIITKIITFLKEKDKNMQYFTAINNGEIKTTFKTIEAFICHLQSADFLDYDMIGDLISMPNILSKYGFNIIIFNKNVVMTNNIYEREKTHDDFSIYCLNTENNTELINKNKDCILIIKDDTNYYPIVMAQKNENEKILELVKTYKYEDKKDNIINHINDFYQKSCMEYLIEKRQIGLTAKMTQLILNSAPKEFNVKYQYIDPKNKCKYLITNNEILIPVYLSGSLYDVTIIKNITKYIYDYDKTLKFLEDVLKTTNQKIPLKQIGIYTQKKQTDGELMMNGIMTNGYYLVPIIPQKINNELVSNKNLLIEPNPQIEEIDKAIENEGVANEIDKRIETIGMWKYHTESYELFRLEFSHYINETENISQRNKLLDIIKDTISRDEKIRKIKLFLYKLIDNDLYQKYKTIATNIQTGGKFIHISDKMPDTNKYTIDNERSICSENVTKDACTKHVHCKWTYSTCLFISTVDNLINMINKLSDELASNEIKGYEIMNIENYFVSDIRSYDVFKERPGQHIVKSTGANSQKVLNEIFGKDMHLYKKKRSKLIEISYVQLNQENPMNDMKIFYSQKIIDNIALFRGYANAYYWLKNKYTDIQARNLGYYHPIQYDLATYFRGLVIDWLLKPINRKKIPDNIKSYVKFIKSFDDGIELFLTKLIKNIQSNSSYIFELYVLNQINQIPIVVYDEYNVIMYIFDNEFIYISTKENDKKHDKYLNNPNYINLKFILKSEHDIIVNKLEVIYYKPI